MSPRPILTYPDPRLAEPAAEVADITDDIRAIWEEMITVMEAMPGVGLAAPQLGIGLRLAVVDASSSRGRAIRLANPEVISVDGPCVKAAESSPCVPGVVARIARPEEIKVAYTDHHGIRVRDSFSGMWARSVQHQIDHLNGKLILDRMSRVTRDMALRKLRKVV